MNNNIKVLEGKNFIVKYSIRNRVYAAFYKVKGKDGIYLGGEPIDIIRHITRLEELKGRKLNELWSLLENMELIIKEDVNYVYS